MAGKAKGKGGKARKGNSKAEANRRALECTEHFADIEPAALPSLAAMNDYGSEFDELPVQRRVAQAFTRFCHEKKFHCAQATAAALCYFMDLDPDSRLLCAKSLYEFEGVPEQYLPVD